MKATNKNTNADELALKEAVQEALGSYDSTVVMQMLTEQGYDPFYAQQLIEEAEDDSVSAKSVIPETVEDDAPVVQEEDPMEAARQNLITDMQAQTMADDEDDDVYQDMVEQEYFGFANGGLVRANYGMEMQDMPNAQYSQGEEQPFITWPTMEGDLMRDGGASSKRAFLKKMTKHLMKANMGMQQDSQAPSPYGDVNNPMGNNVSGKQNFISAVNNQAQMFQAKKQAEQMYNNAYGMIEGGDTNTYGPPLDQHDPMEHLNIYGESLSREFQDPSSMETREMQFGGGFRNRRIKRANKALFGLPMMPPGTSVDYEFGPLGGLRRASAETDLTQLSELFKMLPGSPNANPFVTLPGVIKQVGYTLKVNQGRLVDKAITTINNQSIKEVAAATGNEAAQQKSNETPTVSTSGVIPAATPTKSTVTKTAAKPSPNPVSPTKTSNKAKVQTKPTTSSNGLPNIGKRVEEPKKKYQSKTNIKPNNAYMYSMMPSPYGMEEGGFVDATNPDLYRFIYGGDDISIPYIDDTDMYREGGYIPQAQNGMSSFDQFRLQKTNPDGTLKTKPTLTGGEELMGNPYTQPQQPPVQPSTIPNQSVTPPATQGQGQLTPQQMQQYMQMMQQMGQQTPFAFGAPRGLGLGRAAMKGLTGISRDFNYMTGDNPANWNIPEGYTKLTKETSKDRGKRLNPFDTKRVTTYEYSKPGEAGAAGAPGAGAGQPGANNYGANTNTEGLSGRAARQIRQGERRTERQTARGREEFPDAFQEGTVNQFAKPAGVKPTPRNTGSGIFNVAGDYAEGGYIPEYYAFGGYLPMANYGIVSNNPDFQNPQDPNAVKYTVAEQSGFSMDPSVLGENIGMLSNEIADQEGAFRTMQNTRFNANKTNFANDIDRELAYRGITDQEGIDKKAGFESGRTYTGQYGGAKYKAGGQYKTGGVYSLTQTEIDQIRKMGGDVEFI